MIANMAKGIEIGRLLVFQAGCAQEPRPAQHARDLAREVARDRPLGPGRARRHPDPRRQRLLATSSRSSATCATQGRGHLRGHQPAPHADPGRLRPGLPRGPAAALRAVAGPGLRARLAAAPRWRAPSRRRPRRAHRRASGGGRLRVPVAGELDGFRLDRRRGRLDARPRGHDQHDRRDDHDRGDQVRGDSGSWRTIAPRITATTGFTYA